MAPVQDEFFAATVYALVASIASASLSSLSSVFVIGFILLSQSKLQYAYHRIMFCMSFWDLVSSLAIAATTLPMPAHVHSVYDFAGKAFGTISSCQIQAFLIVIGSGFTIYSNCVLNFYYVFTIRFKMNEVKFNRIILPIFLFLAILTVVPLAATLLKKDLLNPVPFYPYCAVGIYPMNLCVEGDGDDCIVEGLPEFEAMTTIALCTGIIIILISMILVVSTVFETEKKERRNELVTSSTAEEQDEEEFTTIGGGRGDNPAEYSYTHTRAIIRQAVMYIVAFLLTWGWVILSIAPNNVSIYHFVDPMKFTFQPLQGFFNASIFVYSKVYILRKSDRRLSIWHAVKRVITSPRSVPDILVERIDIVLEREGGRDTSTDHEPGSNLVRRGYLVRRADEPPRAIPDGVATGAHDFESIDTPSFSMELSSKMDKTNEANQEVIDDHDDVEEESKGVQLEVRTKKDEVKTSTRRYYQWPPSDWSRSIASGENSKVPDRNKSNSDSENLSVRGLFSWTSSDWPNNGSLVDVDTSKLSSVRKVADDSDSENHSLGGLYSLASSSNKHGLSISAFEKDADSIVKDSLVSYAEDDST